MPDFWFELGQVLVRKGEGNAKFPQFRNHVGDRKRRIGLELVDIEVERGAGLRRNIGTAEAGKCYCRDEEGPEQGSTVVAEEPLAEIDEEYLSTVHDLPKANVGSPWGDCAPESRVR